jgi:hypothetical protein
MIKSTKAFLLAGASGLAILACAAEANAETFTMPGMFTFTASVSGEYTLELFGASGGLAEGFVPPGLGGLGAEVSGQVFLTAGEDLTVFVGGQGGYGAAAAAAAAVSSSMGGKSLPSPAGAAVLGSSLAVRDRLAPAGEQDQGHLAVGPAAWVGWAAARASWTSPATATAAAGAAAGA